MASIDEISLEDLHSTLASPDWASGSLYFLGDIGATNARLGFGRTTSDGGLAVVFVRFAMSRKHIDQLKDFFATIQEKVGPAVLKRIASGALSIPGPVTNGVVGGPFNNLDGVARLSEYPTALFPPGRSALLNDLQAGGFGVLATSDTHSMQNYFTLMWEGTMWKELQKERAGTTLGQGGCVVIAPGTGLGSCYIFYNATAKSFDVIPLEYGSTTTIARPGTEAYLRELAAYTERPQYVPNAEDTVCGNAMEVAYKMRIAGKAGKKPLRAGEVAALAKTGDADALHAMTVLYENLMIMASEMAMTFLPLTVVIMGDNVMRNSFYFEDAARLEHLHKSVKNHPMERYGFLSRATYLRQTKSVNLNLLGCYGFGTHLSQAPVKPASNL